MRRPEHLRLRPRGAHLLYPAPFWIGVRHHVVGYVVSGDSTRYEHNYWHWGLGFWTYAWTKWTAKERAAMRAYRKERRQERKVPSAR